MRCWDCNEEASIMINIEYEDYDIYDGEGASTISGDRFAFCKTCYLKRYIDVNWNIQELAVIAKQNKKEKENKPWYKFW